MSVDAFLKEAEAARRAGRIPEAVALAERAVAAAEGDPLALALARLDLGNLMRYVPDTLRSLQLIAAAELTLRERGHAKLPRALTLRGMALGDAGDHAGALELYREALAILEAPGRERDPLQEAASIGAVGVACTQLGDFAQAESAYLRTAALYEEAGQPDSNAFVYNNLAILRVRAIQALDDRAGGRAQALGAELLGFIERGLAANRAGSDSPFARALLLNTHGDGLRALGRHEEALPILRAALDTYAALANARGEIDAATDLAAALLDLGRVGEALELLERSRGRVEGLGLKDHERRLEELLAQAHERHGDAARALAHFKAFHRLERDLRDLEAQRELQRIALRAEIDKAQRESREDALTGIANRRRFEELAQDAASLPAQFAVAVFDIDHFKRINDTLSHAMGDAVLREVGRILRAHCREEDFVARIGGEEFVQLLRGAGREEALRSCERLRAAVERHPWAALDPALAVTISIGVAASDGAVALPELVQAADARLYEAKRGGRNRVAG